MDIIRESKKAKFNGQFLIWSYQIAKLRRSDDEFVNYYVHDELDATFTKESILNAIDNRLGVLVDSKYGNTYYVTIDYDDLEQVKQKTKEEAEKDIIRKYLQEQMDDLMEMANYESPIEDNEEEKEEVIDRGRMIKWLTYQLTDMDTYDPRSEMEEGEHGLGAVIRIEAHRKDNAIINAIIRELMSR